MSEELEPLKVDKSSAGCIRFTTIYSDQMPDIIRTTMSEGGSIVQAAVACRISRDTLFRWKNPKDPNFIPEIALAVEDGLAMSQDWWETQGRKGLWGGKDGFVPQAFTFQMKNRFRRDYCETPIPEPEITKSNPLIDALKGSAATDWQGIADLAKEQAERLDKLEQTEDIDEHGN